MNNNAEGRVAVESTRLGAGGDRLLAQITGLDEKTIRRGRQELAAKLSERPQQRVRLPGAGRPRTEKRPEVPDEQMQQLNTEQQSMGSQTMRRCERSVHLSKQWQARLTL